MGRSLLALVLLLAAGTARAEECGKPADLHDGWALADTGDMAPDPAVLCAMTERFTAWKVANVHAILVAQGGGLAYEHYFTGVDELWGRPTGPVTFDPATKHDLRSVTKSITGLLIGIAVDRGWIPDINMPAMTFFPEYSDLRTPEKDRITIRDLLTMSAGFEWDESLPYGNPANSERGMDDAADPYRHVWSRKIIAEPGTAYNYCGCSAVLLQAILKKLTGKPLDVLAKELLFDPLGITDVDWWRFGNGDPFGHGGLRMRPRDLAKIGQLVLDHGAWKGRQIVSAAWIEAATAPSIGGEGLFFYGYQWWLGRSWVSHAPSEWIAGVGWGGQRLFIVPKQQLVIVVNAGLYSGALNFTVTDAILNKYVLTSVSGH